MPSFGYDGTTNYALVSNALAAAAHLEEQNLPIAATAVRSIVENYRAHGNAPPKDEEYEIEVTVRGPEHEAKYGKSRDTVAHYELRVGSAEAWRVFILGLRSLVHEGKLVLDVSGME